MGLYDYINGEQVKCFYKAYYSDNSFDEAIVSFSYGELGSYRDNDKVPYRTLFYNHTKNFVVFDYRNSDNLIHIIKDGRVYKTTHLKRITSLDGIEKVIDYYGRTLKIHKIEDFKKLIDDYKIYTMLSEPLNKFNVEKSNERFRDSSTMGKKKAYEKYLEATNEIRNGLEILYNKYINCWYEPKSNNELMGEMIHSIIMFEAYMEDSELNTLKDARKCMKRFIVEKGLDIEEYINWIDADELNFDIREAYKKIME